MPKVGEHLLQLACVRFFRQYYPDLYRNIWHTNGRAINASNGAVLKGMGVVAGVSDLLFFYKGTLHGIELKMGNGRQSDEQKEFEKMLKANGGRYYIVRTLDSFANLINEIVKNG